MSDQVKIQASKVFEFCLDSTKRFCINSGGSRSTKTYSVIQWIVYHALQNTGLTYTICRKTFPALKATVFRDFVAVCNNFQCWDENNLNKTELLYKLNGNIIEFISVDQPQKIRGRKRNILFINEANELDIEDFRQLEIRTTDKIFIDYNPSFTVSWVYDIQDQRPGEIDFLSSTYLDNPFLEESIIKSLQSYKETDPDFWNIFGLGLRGKSSVLIYPKYTSVDTIPDGLRTAIGVDFGYNHPMAVIRVHYGDGTIYVEELLLESYLTTGEMIQKIKPLIRQGEKLYCDSARPDAISELKSAGLDAVGADKSVTAGIDSVKRNNIMVLSTSKGLIMEFRSYRWKQNLQEQILDEPIKIRDDGMDAMRYAVYGEDKTNRTTGNYDYEFIIN